MVGSKGDFRAHQEHVLLEHRAHQKHVLLELGAQQTAHFESKVVILAIFIRITVNMVKLLFHSVIYATFDNNSREKYFMSQYL